MADAEAPKKKATAPKKPAVAKGTRKLNRPRLAISGLTVEQEAYCRGRVMGMSIEEAIAASGSSISIKTARDWEAPNSGNKLVRDRINELAAIAQKNAILKSGLDREWVISRYMMVVERCMQAEPVMKMIDGEMRETGEYKFDSHGANTALRALGDTLGLFKPVEKKPGDEYEHLSDDDIARIATELAAQTGLLEAGAGTQATAGREQVIEVQALPKAD